jgi:hypothetical protein
MNQKTQKVSFFSHEIFYELESMNFLNALNQLIKQQNGHVLRIQKIIFSFYDSKDSKS